MANRTIARWLIAFGVVLALFTALGGLAVGRALAGIALADRQQAAQEAYTHELNDKVEQLATAIISIEQLLSYANQNPMAYKDLLWRELLAQSITIVDILDAYAQEVDAPREMQDTQDLMVVATQTCNVYAEHVSQAVFVHSANDQEGFKSEMDLAIEARSECGRNVLAIVERLEELGVTNSSVPEVPEPPHDNESSAETSPPGVVISADLPESSH